MEREELDLQILINKIAELVKNGKINGDEIPDLYDCQSELMVLIQTYAAVIVRNDKRF